MPTYPKLHNKPLHGPEVVVRVVLYTVYQTIHSRMIRTRKCKEDHERWLLATKDWHVLHQMTGPRLDIMLKVVEKAAALFPKMQVWTSMLVRASTQTRFHKPSYVAVIGTGAEITTLPNQVQLRRPAAGRFVLEGIHMRCDDPKCKLRSRDAQEKFSISKDSSADQIDPEDCAKGMLEQLRLELEEEASGISADSSNEAIAEGAEAAQPVALKAPTQLWPFAYDQSAWDMRPPAPMVVARKRKHAQWESQNTRDECRDQVLGVWMDRQHDTASGALATRILACDSGIWSLDRLHTAVLLKDVLRRAAGWPLEGGNCYSARGHGRGRTMPTFHRNISPGSRRGD